VQLKTNKQTIGVSTQKQEHSLQTKENNNLHQLDDCFINFQETDVIQHSDYHPCQLDDFSSHDFTNDERHYEENLEVPSESTSVVYASAMNAIYQNEHEVDFENPDLMETHSIAQNDHIMEYDLVSGCRTSTYTEANTPLNDVVSETPTYDASDRKFCRITIDDCTEMIKSLSQNGDAEKMHKWSTLRACDFQKMFKTKSTCYKHFRKFELEICAQTLKKRYEDIFADDQKSFTKPEIVARLIELPFEVQENEEFSMQKNIQRRKTVKSLKQLCNYQLTHEPKENLAKTLAENTWKDVYNEWIIAGTVKNSIRIKDLQSNMQWFSQPALCKDGKVRFHFTDACHILTCSNKTMHHRNSRIASQSLGKCCTIAGYIPQYFSNNRLRRQQEVSLARRVFAKDVQEHQISNGYFEEAKFCQLVRKWFDAEDEPGFTAHERCRTRLAFREWLLSGYDENIFPPPTRYMKGIPILTYEALLTHMERKIQIYLYCPDQTYNTRAISSQQVENFFSTFRDLDSTGKGTPKPDSIPKMMKAVAEIESIRLDPNRYFK
jgi:hypothetical protein